MKCCLCCVVDTSVNICEEGFFLGQDNGENNDVLINAHPRTKYI